MPAPSLSDEPVCLSELIWHTALPADIIDGREKPDPALNFIRRWEQACW